MANTYHQVYIHTIFVVKYREAVIDKLWRDDFHKVIGNLISELGCKNIIVNGIEDHVHCLIGLKPTVSISELMKTVKSKSSKYINDQRLTNHRFEWQEGYAVFSYSKSQIDQVFHYIKNQEEHHKKHTFQTEYLEFLKKYEIEIDKKNAGINSSVTICTEPPALQRKSRRDDRYCNHGIHSMVLNNPPLPYIFTNLRLLVLPFVVVNVRK